MGASASGPIWAEDPCGEKLEAYIRCAKKFGGQEPDEYEEYCESERSLYVDCRKSWVDEQKKQAQQTPAEGSSEQTGKK